MTLKHKRSILLSGCFFFFFGSIYSQFSEHKKYTLDTILYLNDLHAVRRVSDYVSYNISDSGFICLYKVKKKFRLETYHFKTGKHTRQIISNKQVNKLNIHSRFSFGVQNDMIIFLSNNLLLGYSAKMKSVFMERNIRDIEYSYLSNSIAYFGRFYNHTLSDSIAPASVYALNLRTIEMDSAILKHDFMEYTHYLPARFLAFSPGEIIYPNFGSYKVYILNKDLKTLDSVVRDIPDWISPSRELNTSIAANQRDLHLYFPLLDKECFEHIDRIEYLEFLDSNQFLVRWYRYDTALHSRKRIIDIWTKKEGKYGLTDSYFETIFPMQMDSLMSLYGIPLRSDEYYTHYTKDYIVQLKSDLPLDPRSCKTYREYLIEREKQGKTNEPKISFWIFKKL